MFYHMAFCQMFDHQLRYIGTPPSFEFQDHYHLHPIMYADLKQIQLFINCIITISGINIINIFVVNNVVMVTNVNNMDTA